MNYNVPDNLQVIIPIHKQKSYSFQTFNIIYIIQHYIYAIRNYACKIKSPVQNAVKDQYGLGMLNEPSGLESGNRSIASLETQMVRRRWIPVQIGLHEAAALRPWMLVPESLVALAAEVRLTYIGVSKTNDHSRELTVPVQKTELVQTKVK
ncbi:Hypothetical_protein [Hexamita inflata]|uniref:Hypothetical_protein n=1 Tax=Hexamita inflata TaxID=28002 RepID=A0AA86UL64_9EUKA|nr:Hypothetical protein HINF_LOCUS50145 [Hexamita inflata]